MPVFQDHPVRISNCPTPCRAAHKPDNQSLFFAVARRLLDNDCARGGIVRVFLKRNEEVFPCKKRNLLAVNFERDAIYFQMVHDKKQPIDKLFQFGPLLCVEHIFECEWVDLVVSANLFDKFCIGQATHICPQDAAFT